MTPSPDSVAVLREKPKPSYAPVYAAALYPQLVDLARQHGYALAVHGSLQRDFDLIAVPWVENPSEPQTLVDAITSGFSAKEVGGPPSDRPHGRRTWSLSIGFGTCAIDLSFMPTTAPGGVGDAVTEDAMGLVPRNFRDETFAEARQQLVNVLKAQKSWLTAYAEAYVDDFAALAARTGKGEANGR